MTDRDVIARALLPKVTSARVKWRTYDEEADAMIAALAAAGRVIVPMEPTEAMTTQGCLAIMDTVLVGPPLIGKSYRAMIAAGGDDG